MLGLYLRISKDDKGEKYSITTQSKEGIKFATSKGLDFQIYQERVSAKNIDDRAQFEELLSDIRAGIVKKVWVIELSRLSRDVKDSQLVKDIFVKNNIELYVHGTLTPIESATDSFRYNIQSAVSEYERYQIIERTKRGKREWQDQGKMAYPSVYGYSFTYNQKGGKDWFPVEEEVATILQIYKWYIEDKMAINQIKLRINASGAKSKRGSIFTNSQVRAILSQCAYIGKIRNSSKELIPSLVYQPIMDVQTWQLAQVELTRKHKTTNYFEQRPATYELSGIVRCSTCGGGYYYNSSVTKNKKYPNGHLYERYYHEKQTFAQKACKQDPRYMVKDNLELQIYNIIRSQFFENDEKLGRWYKHFTTATLKEIDVLELEITGHTTRIEGLTKQKQNIIDAVADGTIDKADVKNKIAELNVELNAQEKKIETKRQLITLKRTESGSEYQLSILKLFREFENLEPIERRRLYQVVFKSITINNNRLTLTFFDDTVERMLVDNARK